MKQILVELDEDLARRLERYAPARARKRSEFVRQAILQALWSIEEEETAAVYRRLPDTEEAAFDPGTWEPPAPGSSGGAGPKR